MIGAWPSTSRRTAPWPGSGLAWWGVVATASFAGWICCTALFCHHVAGWQSGRGMRWFSLGVAVLFLSSVVASALALFALEPAYLTAWLGLANLCFVVYAGAYTVAIFLKAGLSFWLGLPLALSRASAPLLMGLLWSADKGYSLGLAVLLMGLACVVSSSSPPRTAKGLGSARTILARLTTCRSECRNALR